VQLAGRPGDDLKVLRLARDLEEVTGWSRVLQDAIARG
jgi:Asp-tRNA(Asn)/Glu-tRNA(Gln) amidotransferase A subunit family amidase